MTRKACLEQNIEPAFLKALFAVQIYSVTVGKLTLYTKEGKTLAQFRKVD
jgi:heat shock protein HslJ